MEQNVNGYEDNVRVTNGREADSADATAAKADSDLPEKFKSVRALADAYNALQAEFTRRCQRLRELEARADNLSRGENADGENGSSDREGGGKAAAQSEEKTVLSAPPQDAQSPAGAFQNASDDVDNAIDAKGADGAKGANGAEDGANAGGNAGAAPREAEREREESVSERMRLKIIADYLSSLKNNAAPLIRGGAGTLATPPAKPDSIEEAGRMALRYFRA
ncbi:MAG: hypothetical protein ACI4SH_05380 [Candidatus Scatosoma sp.]